MPAPQLEPIIPIILAAGPSPNLPFPKALARFGSKTALEIAIENCKIVGHPIVVLSAGAKRICGARLRRRAILPTDGPKSARVVINRRWHLGQLSSLQAALKKLPGNAAFMIYPVDHPLIRPALIRRLLRAFRTRRHPQEIVMPRHKTSYGHPVIVSAIVRPEFFSAPTARDVIYRHPERLRILRVSTPSIFEDFSSPESYLRCLKKFGHKR